MLNNFVTQFAEFINEGTKNLSSIILLIMSLLALIDLALAYMYEYSDNLNNIMKVFFTKILRYSIFISIARFYPTIINYIIDSIFRIGYLFFPSANNTVGSTGGKIGFPNFDDIITNLTTVLAKIYQAMETADDLGTKITFIIILGLGIFCMFLIVKEIIVNYFEFRMVSAIGMILLPFNVFEYTKSTGEKLPNALISSGMKLIVSIALTGVCLRLLSNNLIDPQDITIANSIEYIFQLALCGFLITNSKEIGGIVVSGSGSSNSSAMGNAISKGVGMATGAVGAAVGVGAYAKGFSQGAKKGYKGTGERKGGILEAMKTGHTAGKNNNKNLKNSRKAKIGRKLSKGVQNTIDYATGNKDVSNIGSDLWKGTGDTLLDQFLHDTDGDDKRIED